ncbi:MAG TPA: NADH-quinone oxidoreductase subunit N [Bacteroidia bacterium]|nr:NADH-quinone oxidoreductase subunit N [Bacteroidia bacterium]
MDSPTSYLAHQLSLLGESVGGIFPEFVLIAGFLLAIFLEITVGKRSKWILPMAAIGTVVLFLGANLVFWPAEVPLHGSFLGMITPDRFAAYMKLLVGVGTLLALIAAQQSTKLRIDAKGMGEYYIVLLGMTVGMAFMTMAQNLLMVYLALEMVSLPAYALTAYARMRNKSAEAALKYVIYGCFASGVMLYGISWLYGFTGTLDPHSAAFGQGLVTAGVWPVTMMMVLVLGGFAFKVGALPFHFWMPDVMEGAPHPVASLLAVAPKVAGFAMLIRFFASIHQSVSLLPADEVAGLMQNLSWVLAILAIGSMLLGNLAALRQDNLRRMLAYSSIAQAGYILAGVLFFQSAGFAVVLFYLTIYLCMNMVAFLLAGWLEEEAGIKSIKELKGLSTSLPWVAFITALAMVSLTGLPPTAGFIAKLRLFLAGFAEYQTTGQVVLVVLLIAVLLNTVLSLFYYLSVASTMVFGNPVIKTWPRFRGLIPVMLVILSVPLLWLGIFSFDRLINFLQSLAPFANG